MKNVFLFIVLNLLITSALFSQIAINADGSAPDNSAMLDVKSTNKGLLPPRVELTAINSPDPVISPAVGLFVYNTANAGTPPNNVTTGYYYWNGTHWIPVFLSPGLNAGDLLRWDGVQWSCLSPGSNGMALIVTSGVPNWGYYPVPVPLLLTFAASGITAIDASGGGTVCDVGTLVTARGVCWSTSSNPTISGSKTSNGDACGTFTSGLTGLAANTKYYVRAYATNSAGTGYGNEVNFTTRDGIITLTTTAASAITAISATSGGTISDDGGAAVTARGVCWRTTSGPTITDSKTSNGTGTGTFPSNLTGLTPNTKYYIRAYAINSVGTSYGNEVSFTTRDGIITLTTTNVTCIVVPGGSSGGNITDDGGAAVTARGVCWNTSPNPTTASNHTTDGSGIGSFTSNLSLLVPNTQYYLRAYATNSVGTGYGNEVSFTTSQFYIGLSYGGGIIYYLDCTGQHGLIAPTTDQSSWVFWGCSGTLIGGTSTAIGTGQANTTAIVNGCSETATAARICNDLVLNGYDDWFLPSRDELNQLYLQRTVIGGITGWYYWSSSETNSLEAMEQWFTSGAMMSIGKFGNEGGTSMRCTRSF